MTGRPELTAREVVILKLLADDRSPADIGQLLEMNKSTARDEVAKILAKLHAKTVSEAVATGVTAGIIGPLANRGADRADGAR